MSYQITGDTVKSHHLRNFLFFSDACLTGQSTSHPLTRQVTTEICQDHLAQFPTLPARLQRIPGMLSLEMQIRLHLSSSEEANETSMRRLAFIDQ